MINFILSAIISLAVSASTFWVGFNLVPKEPLPVQSVSKEEVRNIVSEYLKVSKSDDKIIGATLPVAGAQCLLVLGAVLRGSCDLFRRCRPRKPQDTNGSEERRRKARPEPVAQQPSILRRVEVPRRPQAPVAWESLSASRGTPGNPFAVGLRSSQRRHRASCEARCS